MLSLILAALALSVTLSAQTPPKERMVVLISLDGFPAYALEDPKLPVPTLRKLARQGSMARRMSIVNPTVTWPNHTAMVTGVDASRHHVLANGSIVATGEGKGVRVEPWIDKDKMVRATTLYDQAHRAGLTTAQVDWVAIHKAPTINWAFPEVPSVDGVIEKEMIARGMITAPEIEEFRKGNIVWRDQVWTDAASHIIRTHKPNLLQYHLLTLDSTHHTYGPRTLAGTTAMAFLDRSVAQILDAIRDAGMTDRATVLVVSDHGFKPYMKTVQPAVTLAAAGLGGKVFVLPEGGTAFLYCDSQNADAARKALAGAEGVDRILSPAELGLPGADEDAQSPRLILAAKEGYSFGGGATGSAVVARPSQGGSHGYPASDPDMDAIFIASGNGVRAGMILDRVRTIDIAPTLAVLLGVELPQAEGRALREILR